MTQQSRNLETKADSSSGASDRASERGAATDPELRSLYRGRLPNRGRVHTLDEVNDVIERMIFHDV